MDSGIYVLKTEKHFYIGLSSNLKARKREHFWNLKNNKHPNNKVQNVYNKGYKIEFEILENVEVSELEDKEIWWFNKYKEEHPALTPLNLKECGSKPTYSWEARENLSKGKCKKEYDWNKKYNAIDYNSDEFLATGTILEISKWYSININYLKDRNLKHNYKPNTKTEKRFYIIEALEYPVNVEDIEYMNGY